MLGKVFCCCTHHVETRHLREFIRSQIWYKYTVYFDDISTLYLLKSDYMAKLSFPSNSFALRNPIKY